MISGMAGNNIVSPYMVIICVKPKIASVIQAVLGIFFCVLCSDRITISLLSCGFDIMSSITKVGPYCTYFLSIEINAFITLITPRKQSHILLLSHLSEYFLNLRLAQLRAGLVMKYFLGQSSYDISRYFS